MRRLRHQVGTGDFVDPVSEGVLPGSAVRLQWHRGVNGWRCLTETDADRDRPGLANPVEWRLWTGNPASVIKMSIVRGRQRWWVLAGELPWPDSMVVVQAQNGPRPAVSLTEGRVWSCEWSGVPSTATINVDDSPEVTVDFRRRLHYPSADSRRDSPEESGGYGRGWTSYAPHER